MKFVSLDNYRLEPVSNRPTKCNPNDGLALALIAPIIATLIAPLIILDGFIAVVTGTEASL